MSTTEPTRSDPAAAPTSLAPADLWQIWRRRKWAGAFAFGATVAATAGVVLSLPNLYRATATVLVDRQSVEALVRPPVFAELDTRIQTIHQRITSRERLSALILRFDLYPGLRRTEPMDTAVEKMRRDVQLRLKGVDQPNGRTETISFGLTYSGRDAALVAEVANTLVASYIAENIQSREHQATGTADVLEQQVAAAGAALDAQDRRTAAFTARYGTQLAPQLQANLTAIGRVTGELRSNSDAQIRAVERRERLQTMVPPEPVVRVPGPDSLEAQLARLTRDLTELRRTYTDAYPEVVRVQRQITALEGQLALVPPVVPVRPAPVDARSTAAAVAEVDSELRQLKDEETALRRSVAEYDARIQNTPGRQQDLDDLTRGYASARERYQTLLKQYTDARLTASLEQGQRLEQFRVLDPAVPPRIPAAPDRQMLALMGLVAAFAAGLVVIAVAEKLDTTFHSVGALRAFVDLPVLATIRHIPTRATVRRRRWRGALATCAALVAFGLIGVGAYHFAAGNERIVALITRGGT